MSGLHLNYYNFTHTLGLHITGLSYSLTPYLQVWQVLGSRGVEVIRERGREEKEQEMVKQASKFPNKGIKKKTKQNWSLRIWWLQRRIQLKYLQQETFP